LRQLKVGQLEVEKQMDGVVEELKLKLCETEYLLEMR